MFLLYFLIVSQSRSKKKEYYLNGIPYDFEMWKEIKKSGEGLPWYKQSGNTIKTSRF